MRLARSHDTHRRALFTIASGLLLWYQDPRSYHHEVECRRRSSRPLLCPPPVRQTRNQPSKRNRRNSRSPRWKWVRGSGKYPLLNSSPRTGICSASTTLARRCSPASKKPSITPWMPVKRPAFCRMSPSSWKWSRMVNRSPPARPANSASRSRIMGRASSASRFPESLQNCSTAQSSIGCG